MVVESLVRPLHVRFAFLWGFVASAVLFLGTGVAEAAGEPFGAPVEVTATNAQQNAIIGGAAASAVGVTCVVTAGSGGGGCAVAGAISGFVTPLIAGAAACPHEGVRKIRLQPVQQAPTMSNPEGSRFKVISNRCVPA